LVEVWFSMIFWIFAKLIKQITFQTNFTFTAK
jgi:hypothetical protein